MTPQRNHLISGSNVCVVGIRLKNIHFIGLCIYTSLIQLSVGRPSLCKQLTLDWYFFEGGESMGRFYWL
jgi:hypothetical protein